MTLQCLCYWRGLEKAFLGRVIEKPRIGFEHVKSDVSAIHWNWDIEFQVSPTSEAPNGSIRAAVNIWMSPAD